MGLDKIILPVFKKGIYPSTIAGTILKDYEEKEMGYKNGGLEPNRYIVTKSNGTPNDEHADYFVLRLDKDPHALVALAAYAMSVKIDNEEFSDDLMTKLFEFRLRDKQYKLEKEKK